MMYGVYGMGYEPQKIQYGTQPDERGMQTMFAGRVFAIFIDAERKRVKVPGKNHSLRGPVRVNWDHPLTGRLHGPVYKHPISDGVNVAECRRGQNYRSLPPPGTPTHKSPDPGCQCGFYGFLAPQQDNPAAKAPAVTLDQFAYGTQVCVQAVVEVGGRVLVGTRGLRAEQMRLVALAEPARAGDDSDDKRSVADVFGPRLTRAMQEHYPDVPIFDTAARMLAEIPLSPLPPAKSAAA